MMKFHSLTIFLLLLVQSVTAVKAQDTFKIMTYNLLRYPGTDTAVRNPYFRVIMRNVAPDILIVQEMYSQTGMNGFVSNVLNQQGDSFAAGTFIDGPDTDRGCFYRK